MPLTGSFSCSIPFAVWHFCGRGAPCPSDFVWETGGTGEAKWSSFRYKISTKAHYYPGDMFVNLKKRERNICFSWKITHAFNKIPPQTQNYARNCEVTKRAHISQFSLEILQRPCKLLIKNRGNQRRHLLEKLTELNKAFHFWSNNGLEKCFLATQKMSNSDFFTSLQGLSP